jgi:ABC-type glycerol-3-phosphate transport system substrate-binding protein
LSAALVGAAAVAAACSSAPPAAPTAAPAAPAAPAAAAPTNTPAPAPAAAAPTATTAPAAAAAAPTATTAPAAAPTATTAPAAQAAPAAGSTEIQFYSPATDKLGNKIIAELADQYNKKQSKISAKVITVPTDNHYAKYVTAIAGGQSPDGIMTYDYTPMVDWASQGFILPLDDYQKTMGIKKEDYFPVAWNMIFFHGHLWGFIQEFDYNILAWNKTLLQKAGINPDPSSAPKTTDDLDKLAAQLTVKDAGGNLKQIGFCPWITGSPILWAAMFGGIFYDPNADKWTIVNDGNVASLDWHAKYSKQLGGPDKVTTFQKIFTGDQTPFYQEQMVYESMGEYIPITMPDVAPKLQYAVAYPPPGPGVPYGTAQTDGGNMFVLPKGAQHPAEGMDFMVYMGGADAVLQWNVEENNIPPVQKVAYDQDFLSKTPLMKTWIDLLKENKMVPPATSPITPFFSDQLNTARDEVIFGKKSSKQALTNLAAKVDDQIKQFKAAHPDW